MKGFVGLWINPRVRFAKSWANHGQIQAMAQQNVEVGILKLKLFGIFFWVLGLVWYFVFGTWEWSCKFWVCFLFFFNCEKRFVLKSRSFFGERRITKLEVACWLWQEPGALPSTEVRDAAPAGILRFWMENSMARDGFGFGHIGIRMSLPTVNEPWSEMIVNFVGKNNHDSTTKRHTIAISSNETKRKH